MEPIAFDSSGAQAAIPPQFVWPMSDRRPSTDLALEPPTVDLRGFSGGDVAGIEALGLACASHGMFQVINHGVEGAVMRDAIRCMGEFFGLPLRRKRRAVGKRENGSKWGYAGVHSDRFTENLPWKETLSLAFDSAHPTSSLVDYFTSNLGNDFREMGMVYQRYCEAMTKLSNLILEMLAMSLGMERGHFRELFSESHSIIRCNYYPICQEPEMTFGTGPHCDPTSITILLQQDDVHGLEVFTAGEWHLVKPLPGALIINIGDTFMALTNGRYKSCLHRAVVNRNKERRSLAFFLSPRGDKVVTPSGCLVDKEHPRKYPDFTWAQFFDFTQTHYRADALTLQTFVNWIRSSN